MPRQLRPRQPVALGACYVSQLTCLPLLGIDARRFLEALVPRCKGSVVPLGKLRLVPVEAAVEALRGLAEGAAERNPESSSETATAVTDDDDQPRSVDDVLRRLGHERIPA